MHAGEAAVTTPAADDVNEDLVDARTPVQYHWLPEAEQLAAIACENREQLVVAVAVSRATRPHTVLLVRGDGMTAITNTLKFERSGDGVVPDFSAPRPTDHGHTIRFGEYESSAVAALAECDDRVGRLFPPSEFTELEPDAQATPEQVPLLDRLVAVANRWVDGPIQDQADRAEWQAVIAELHKTIPGLYGSEWIHRGWNLTLHGPKVFANLWSPERYVVGRQFWNKMMRSRGVLTRRVQDPDV
jgi:hypothetical protein